MADDSPQVQALKASLNAWIKENTPEGARLSFSFDDWVELEVCCPGRVPYMVYRCVYAPGHDGDCYCRIKNVNFQPEVF